MINKVKINYNKKNFQSSTSIKWCPGCGDYSIYNAVINTFVKLNILRENFLIISGIGCSSRFPYYCQTYGFHTLHGRAPTVAMGAKINNPLLSVWVVTGDGDALSIGGNHFIHIVRKNPDIKILLFNNEIYGLTKGQFSPTSKKGLKTKTSPFGTIENPVNVLALSLTMGATFIARVVATDTKHMQSVLVEAGHHNGICIIEILTNCIIFNDDAFYPFETKSIKEDHVIFLNENQPLIYGKNKDKGLFLKNMKLHIADLNKNKKEKIIIHNLKEESLVTHFLLTQIIYPIYPLPIGILRKIDKPTFNDILYEHIEKKKRSSKIKNVDDLLRSGDTWEI